MNIAKIQPQVFVRSINSKSHHNTDSIRSVQMAEFFPSRDLPSVEEALADFRNAGINAKLNKNNRIVLASYSPDRLMASSFKHPEQDIFFYVEEIEGYADFCFSELERLENVKRIGKNANFTMSNIVDTGALEEIGKDAFYSYSKISSLKNLRRVGRDLHLENSNIRDLAMLESVGRKTYYSEN